MLLELTWRNVGNSTGPVLWNEALAYLKVASDTPSGPYLAGTQPGHRRGVRWHWSAAGVLDRRCQI
jgi:hypothetical protein